MSSSADHDPWQAHLESETHSASRSGFDPEALAVPTITLVWHPSLGRVGECLALPELARGGEVQVSRLRPLFPASDGGEARPLADPRLSRRPISIRLHGEAVLLDPGRSRTALRVDGEPVTTPKELPTQLLQEGVLLSLADRVLLMLHYQSPVLTEPKGHNLVGSSDAIRRVRREIDRIAPHDVAVLITGESGTGKELVARAIQAAGRRRNKPFVAINMAAVTSSLAGAELFGASKGAYSGAGQRRDGFFQRAHGGTLFLDEIGDTPLEVQSLLLRALETGEVQPVGAEKAQTIDVRLVAATDADLETAVTAGRFRAPLLHRLGTVEIAIPPLRQRRVDIGSLMLHFLRQELSAVGAAGKLLDSGPYGKPWFPAPVAERLILFTWPGNIRQLRNVIRQMVVSHRDSAKVEPGPRFERWAEADPTICSAGDLGATDEPHAFEGRSRSAVDSESTRATARDYRDPSTIDEDTLIEALRRHRWQPRPAAEDLGISRPSLYNLIDRSTKVRKASELTREEIELANNQQAGELEAMAEALQVSVQGLKRRLREIGRDRG